MTDFRTPFPVGVMPEGIKQWPDGPPYGRVYIEVVDTLRDAVLDQITGEWFLYRVGVDCGLGCKCAAEVEWTRAPADGGPDE